MRVCFVTNSFSPDIGGLESYVYTTAKMMGELGHDIYIITGEPSRPTSEYIGQAGSIKQPFIRRQIPYLKDFCQGKGAFYEAAAVIFKTIEEIRPDICNVQDPLPLFLVSLIRQELRIPIVFTFHCTFGHWEQEIARRDWVPMLLTKPEQFQFEKSLMSFIFRQCPYERIICVGKPFWNWALELGVDEQKMVYIPNSVDTTTFLPRRPDLRLMKTFGFNKGDKVLLTPARFIPRKGLDRLLQAMNKLKVDHKLRLLIVGDADPSKSYLHHLHSEIKRFNLERSVRISEANIKEMPALYSFCKAVILLSDYEGLSTVVLEALACGKPLILSDIQANREIVQDGIHALMVDQNSSEDVANAIKTILSNNAICEFLVRHGKRLVEESYNARKNILLLLNVYETLLGTIKQCRHKN